MSGDFCQNCGHFVDERTIRVLYPEGVDIPACPNCPDIGRAGMYEKIKEVA